MPISNIDLDGLEPLEKITAVSVTGDGTVVLSVADDWVVVESSKVWFLGSNRFSGWKSQGCGCGLSIPNAAGGLNRYAGGVANSALAPIAAIGGGILAAEAVTVMGYNYLRSVTRELLSEVAQSLIFSDNHDLSQMDLFDALNPSNIVKKYGRFADLSNAVINLDAKDGWKLNSPKDAAIEFSAGRVGSILGKGLADSGVDLLKKSSDPSNYKWLNKSDIGPGKYSLDDYQNINGMMRYDKYSGNFYKSYGETIGKNLGITSEHSLKETMNAMLKTTPQNSENEK